MQYIKSTFGLFFIGFYIILVIASYLISYTAPCSIFCLVFFTYASGYPWIQFFVPSFPNTSIPVLVPLSVIINVVLLYVLGIFLEKLKDFSFWLFITVMIAFITITFFFIENL